MEEMITLPKSEYDKLVIKINQLERRLSAYENAHTPSSMQRFKKKD